MRPQLWPRSLRALLLASMSNVQPYSCPFCQAEMLFEEPKNHYLCPDCETIVALGDRPANDKSEDTE